MEEIKLIEAALDNAIQHTNLFTRVDVLKIHDALETVKKRLDGKAR